MTDDEYRRRVEWMRAALAGLDEDIAGLRAGLVELDRRGIKAGAFGRDLFGAPLQHRRTVQTLLDLDDKLAKARASNRSPRKRKP